MTRQVVRFGFQQLVQDERVCLRPGTGFEFGAIVRIDAGKIAE
jgi:hypothetical protein